MVTSIFSRYFILFVGLTISTMPFAHVQDSIRIAAVNSARILQESTFMQIAEKKIKEEFAKRAKNLQDISQKLESMSSSLEKNSKSFPEKNIGKKKQSRYIEQLKSDFQIKQKKFYEDLNQRRNEELIRIVDKINKVIKQIAEQQNYDLVVQEAVYADPRIDITDKVLKALSLNEES